MSVAAYPYVHDTIPQQSVTMKDEFLKMSSGFHIASVPKISSEKLYKDFFCTQLESLKAQKFHFSSSIVTRNSFLRKNLSLFLAIQQQFCP